MREILDDVKALLAGGEDFALVTLVSERGSTPRAEGAEMVVRRDGSIAGTIGGGLLEATMMAEAAAVLREGRSRIASLRLAGRSITEQEMLCGGSADALVAFVPGGDPALRAVCDAITGALAAGLDAWYFTVFTTDRDDAAVSWCLLVGDGEVVGTPPCAADALRRVVHEVGVHGAAALPDGREAHAEAIRRPTTAVICGAGHVALALAPVAAHAGFEPVVLDDRPEFADAGRFPTAASVVALDSFDAVFSRRPVGPRDYVVIMTRSHTHDFNVLAQALRTPAAYIGLMSSRTKWKTLRAGLRELGFGEADIARVHAPIGLPIGAETPAELAVSIVAELIEVRAGKTV